MELINNFIVTLVTTLIFITAIELVAPDNSMKKYLKFVLGLMLIAVILNPIVNFFTKGQVFLDDLIDKYTNEVSKPTAASAGKESDKKIMEKSFKDNFNKNCVSMLSKEFPEYDFTSDLECKVDFGNTTFEITSLKIVAKEKGIRKVEKIDLSKEKTNEEEDDTQKRIKEYISEELEVDKDKIRIYYNEKKEE